MIFCLLKRRSTDENENEWSFLVFISPRMFYWLFIPKLLSRSILSVFKRDSRKMAQHPDLCLGHLAILISFYYELYQIKDKRRIKNHFFSIISDWGINCLSNFSCSCYQSANTELLVGITLFFFCLSRFLPDFDVAKSVVPGWYKQNDNKRKKQNRKDGRRSNKQGKHPKMIASSLLGVHRTTIPYSFMYTAVTYYNKEARENKFLMMKT